MSTWALQMHSLCFLEATMPSTLNTRSQHVQHLNLFSGKCTFLFFKALGSLIQAWISNSSPWAHCCKDFRWFPAAVVIFVPYNCYIASQDAIMLYNNKFNAHPADAKFMF